MFSERDRQLAFLSTVSYTIRILIPVSRKEWVEPLLKKPEILHKHLLRAPEHELLIDDA